MIGFATLPTFRRSTLDAKKFIDDLIASATRLSDQGRNLAEEKLGIPQQGEQRDAMLDGMGKGALAAGALAILLGTGVGRRITGSALKLGGLAAVGAVAYKAYRHWQEQQAGAVDEPGTPVGELTAPGARDRSELLLQAVVVAAMADGHIDGDERFRIERQLAELGLEQGLEQFIAEQLQNPPGAADLAVRADSPEAAAEIYLVSRLVIDPDNDAERRYLDELVAALGLDPALREELERHAAAAG